MATVTGSTNCLLQCAHQLSTVEAPLLPYPIVDPKTIFFSLKAINEGAWGQVGEGWLQLTPASAFQS